MIADSNRIADSYTSAQSWRVAVLVPARNEEDLLPRCLHSILIATAALPASVRSEVIVLADSSVDRTSQIASDILRSRGRVVNASVGTVGTARRLAAHYILARNRGPLNRLWLANTDADCIVPPSWIADQLQLAEERTEAIAGTISVDSFEEHEPEVADRFRATYVIATDGTHPHVHGANIGVLADAYCRAGGWKDLRTAEDHDLWRRLIRIGARTVSTARIEVVTSGRRRGRAPDGFAGALAAHNKTQAVA
jgi:glycosyltransferase involved in cell wall biosynthesis